MILQKIQKFSTLNACLLLLGLCNLVHARQGGGEVGNGGGIAEQNVTLAYVNLEKYIALCLNNSNCQLNNKERQLLQKISDNMSLERQNSNQIQYGSESAEPGSFWIDGQIRIAKTGDTIGSPVVFNRDLLYWRDPTFGLQYLSLSTALGIWIHELGHHHIEDNHNMNNLSMLDLLGTKVQNMLLENRLEISGYPYLPQLSATVINFPSSFEIAQLLVADSYKQAEISGLILPVLHCDPINQQAKIVGLSLWNLRWELHDQSQAPFWEIVSGAFVTCSQGIIPLPAKKFMIRIQVPIARPPGSNPGPQSFRMNTEEITVAAKPCAVGDTSCQ